MSTHSASGTRPIVRRTAAAVLAVAMTSLPASSLHSAPGGAPEAAPGGAESASAEVRAHSAQNERIVLLPDAIVAPDGQLVRDVAVVIEAGRIASIEPASTFLSSDVEDSPDGLTTILHRPGTILSPGLIDVGSGLGVYGNRTEQFHPIDPAIRVASGVNPADPGLEAAMRRGVTAALVIPTPTNLIGGAAAVIRTTSHDGGRNVGESAGDGSSPLLLEHEGPLVVSLGGPVLRLDRAPTSRAGALSMLRNTFNAARNAPDTPDTDDLVARALRGEHGILVIADSAEDVTAATRLFDSYGVTAAIMHTSNDVAEVAGDLLESRSPLIVGPLSFSSPVAQLLAPGRLAAAGVEVGFASALPAGDVDSLRITAALAVRFGMDPAAARRGLTSTAAQIAGVAGRIGSIEPGQDADLVLFSGDPLALDSRVLEVYVQGRRAWTARGDWQEQWADADYAEEDIETPDAGDIDDVDGE